MSPQTFKGTSKEGNFQEALEAAITSAKESLPMDLIKWKIESISGEYGGFVLKNEIYVAIDVEIPKK